MSLSFTQATSHYIIIQAKAPLYDVCVHHFRSLYQICSRAPSAIFPQCLKNRDVILLFGSDT